MNRKDRWRQNSPSEQMTALLGSVLGDLLNIREGYSTFDEVWPRVKEQLQDSIDLSTMIKNDRWP